MAYTVSKIKEAFGHKLIGTKHLMGIVAKTLLIFPDKIINFITKHCWVVSSFPDGWAFVLRGGDIRKDEFLIFLSDELLAEDEGQIRYTLVHEIGHIILGHRNSIGKVQSKKEVRKQEKVADAFAKKFLG